ncbi:MAG: hypothetical protein AB8B63_25120 [Granulosicoccus sp.]
MKVNGITRVCPCTELHDASNDPDCYGDTRSHRSPPSRGNAPGMRSDNPQVIDVTQSLRVELRTVECTMNRFKDEISQSLDSALRLDFGS